MDKMSLLHLPDNIYNWINDFFHNRYHCTKFAGNCSIVAQIQASVIQGSGLGPASYIVTAADLHPKTNGNQIFKYADDTYLVVPAINSESCLDEIEHIHMWAAENNLKVNQAKSKEVLFITRSKVGRPTPPLCSNIERVSCLRILGVLVNDKLTADDHVNSILTSCTSLLHAFRVLRNHGLPNQSLQDIYHAVIIAKLTYASPAWSGSCSAKCKAKLDSFVCKSKRLGYCSKDQPAVTQLFDEIDDSFFARILSNSEHLLHKYLPECHDDGYDLRPRPHNKLLIKKTAYLNNDDFFIRMLYKHCY
jgi:hypothetical protein